MKTEALRPVTENEIFSFWDSYATEDDTTENYSVWVYFKPYIEALGLATTGRYYWQIYALNNPRILFAGGAIEEITPYTKETIFKAKPQDVLNDFHPAEKDSVLACILKMVDILDGKKMDEKMKTRFAIYARYRRQNGDYAWTASHYPAFYFNKKGTIAFGLVVYIDISHIVQNIMKPFLQVEETLNANTKFTKYNTIGEIESEETYPSMTKRELQVVQLLLQGRVSKQIAAEMGISRRTVDNFRQGLLKKFNATGTVELIAKLTGIKNILF